MADRLDKAAKAYRDALSAVEEAKRLLAEGNEAVRKTRPELAEAIVDAARAGVKQGEIVRVSGYTRERVRQLCRAAGVEPVE